MPCYPVEKEHSVDFEISIKKHLINLQLDILKYVRYEYIYVNPIDLSLTYISYKNRILSITLK
jgi:hypothetical protein